METLFTLLIELFLPFGLFGPFYLQLISVLSLVGLNITISITGNYGFFNFLYAITCFTVLDNNFYKRIFSLGPIEEISYAWNPQLLWSELIYFPVLATYLTVSTVALAHSFKSKVVIFPDWVISLFKKLAPFHLGNPYGLFAVMTTIRNEIVIEGIVLFNLTHIFFLGSYDGETWNEIEFKYKPGNVDKRPPFIPGHMPRLDWRMWFLAFHQFPNIPTWFLKFLNTILSGSKDVFDLLDLENFPFKEGPPKLLRVQFWQYKFTDRKTLKNEGHWWRREYIGPFLPFTLQASAPQEAG